MMTTSLCLIVLIKNWLFLELHPDYILVSCLCEFITEEGKVIGQSIQPCTDRALKRRCNILHPGAMFCKDAYFKAGGYLDIRTGQDTVLWGRMAKYGEICQFAGIINSISYPV